MMFAGPILLSNYQAKEIEIDDTLHTNNGNLQDDHKLCGC